MSGIIVNYAWSQLANPVPVAERKRRIGDGLSPHIDDRLFNTASVSDVVEKMMTKNGVLMQVIINTVKVSEACAKRSRARHLKRL